MAMIRWRQLLAILTFSIALFSSSAIWAVDVMEKIGHIKGGVSPDGRTEVTFLAKPDETGIAEFYLRFSEVKSGRVLNRFRSDYASFVDVPFQSFGFTLNDGHCVWRSDSRSVAATYVMTRGFVGTTIYTRLGKRWAQAEIPDFGEQLRKFCRAAGEKRVVFVEDAPGKGHETFLKWLPRHRFRLEAGYRGFTVPEEEDERIFWITFRIVDPVGKSKPKIVLDKIEFAPDPHHPVKK